MEFRKVSLDNLSRLSEMFKLCLNRDVNESYFLWKYKNNPAGEVVAFEAVEGDTIAAFYGVIPERYCIDRQEYTVYQSMDTMTHPDFQKRGLFTKLAKMTYDYLREQNGSVYIIGIPGGNSFHGFVNKLDWMHIHDFKYLFLPTNIGKFLNLFTNTSKWIFENITFSDADFQYFLQESKCKTDSKIQPLLDASVFQWKVWEHPFKNYRVVKIASSEALCGYCISSLDDKGYLKIEQLFCNFQVNALLVKALTLFLIKNNPSAKYLYTWEPTNELFKNAYRKAFFIKNPLNRGLFSYRIPFITYANNSYLNGKNWKSITDFDVQPFMQD